MMSMESCHSPMHLSYLHIEIYIFPANKWQLLQLLSFQFAFFIWLAVIVVSGVSFTSFYRLSLYYCCCSSMCLCFWSLCRRCLSLCCADNRLSNCDLQAVDCHRFRRQRPEPQSLCVGVLSSRPVQLVTSAATLVAQQFKQQQQTWKSNNEWRWS